MASTHVSVAPAAVNKTMAHILKHSRCDCVGLLLGSGIGKGQVEVNDVVPLFHERVMASTTETAFEMVEAINDGNQDRQIIGVYDAPIKGVNEEANQPLSILALNLAEQIKQASDSLDAIVVRIKVPQGGADEPASNSRTREVTEEEAESMQSVVLQAYAVQGTTMSKKIALSTGRDPDSVVTEMISSPARPYLDIVDFDDHFADVSKDWTNPEFE